MNRKLVSARTDLFQSLFWGGREGGDEAGQATFNRKGGQCWAKIVVEEHCEKVMWTWIWCSFLSISVVNGADVLRIPLIQTSSPTRRLLGKRAGEVGVAQLVDDVLPGSPNLDLAYLGAVSIGTPPQEFLLRTSPGGDQSLF